MGPGLILIMLASAFFIASTTIGIGQEDDPLDRLLSKDQQVKLGVTQQCGPTNENYSAKSSPTHSDRAMKLGRGMGCCLAPKPR